MAGLGELQQSATNSPKQGEDEFGAEGIGTAVLPGARSEGDRTTISELDGAYRPPTRRVQTRARLRPAASASSFFTLLILTSAAPCPPSQA